MAMKITTGSADVILNALGAECNSGVLRIYDGTEPATANTTLSSNNVLAELTLSSTAFGAPSTSGSDRMITAGTITADSSADATGTATFFRVFKTGGSTVVYQGTAGTSGQQLNLNSTSIIAGGNVSISSLTITMPTA